MQRDGWFEFLFLRPLRGARGWMVYIAVLALLGVVYFGLGSVLIAETNLDLQTADQRANLDLAYASARDWYPHRNSYIQPLWPWLSRLVMDEDIAAYFTRGRWLNLSFGYLITVTMAILAARRIAPVPGFTVGLITGIGVMLQRAHYFHPEPLLYAFFTATVVFMALSLWRSRWIYYAAWGFFFGLAYLTKGSTGPLLGLYAGATVVLLTIRAGWWPRSIVVSSAPSVWGFGRHLAGSALALAVAAALMAPGAVYKYRVHGDPLYSPFKYYMWVVDYDNGVVPVTPRIETAEGRASFAPGELPTAANYVRKHGWVHVRERLSRGVSEMAWRFIVPVHKVERALGYRMFKGKAEKNEPPQFWRYLLGARGLYLAWFGAIAVVLLAARRAIQGPPLFRSDAALPVALFGLAGTIGYLLAFGWYAPVVGWRAERLTLLLYLPLLAGFVWSGCVLARDLAATKWRYLYAAGIVLVLAHAMVQVALLIAKPHFMPGI